MMATTNGRTITMAAHHERTALIASYYARGGFPGNAPRPLCEVCAGSGDVFNALGHKVPCTTCQTPELEAGEFYGDCYGEATRPVMRLEFGEHGSEWVEARQASCPCNACTGYLAYLDQQAAQDEDRHALHGEAA